MFIGTSAALRRHFGGTSTPSSRSADEQRAMQCRNNTGTFMSTSAWCFDTTLR
jgi:hypothetical protein